MSTMSDRETVAANSVVANAIAGKTHEFIKEASIVRLFMSAAAVGLFASFIVGDEIILEDQEVSSSNRFPVIPDDFVAEAGALVGDRVVVKLRNSTGAGIQVITRVEVVPA